MEAILFTLIFIAYIILGMLIVKVWTKEDKK